MCWGGGAEVEKQDLGTFVVTFSMESTAHYLQGAGPVPYARGWDRRRARDTPLRPLLIPLSHPQGYQWLKDKILSEEGRRQQAKLKELQAIAERLGCTLPQLAIGKGAGEGGGGAAGPRSGSTLCIPSLVSAERGRQLRPAGCLQRGPADGEHRSNTGEARAALRRGRDGSGAALHHVGRGGFAEEAWVCLMER